VPVASADLLRRMLATPPGRRVAPTVRRTRARALEMLGAPSSTAWVDAVQPFDAWLRHVGGAELERIDVACAAAGPDDRAAFALFAELDVDLWAMLLSQQYRCLPHIKALLPGVPEPALQQLWNGAGGARLANQSKTFYAKVCERQARYGTVALTEARVLDHGCGWGRLVRFFARDVAPGNLFGVDPTPMILDVCRRDRVPAELHQIDFLASELPVQQIDLAYSFSVFTHLSPTAADRALQALHKAIVPGGILVVTVRPPAYLEVAPEFQATLAELGPGWSDALAGPHHLFVAHPAQDSHYQYDGGEMTYGEAIVTIPWIRERWAPRFEILDVAPLVGDLHQVMITLRRSDVDSSTA
jgi:SAM-dependent methyltransferase